MKIVAFLDRWSGVVIGLNLLAAYVISLRSALGVEDWYGWYIDGFAYCLNNSCEQNRYYWLNLIEGSVLTVPFALVLLFAAYKLIRHMQRSPAAA